MELLGDQTLKHRIEGKPLAIVRATGRLPCVRPATLVSDRVELHSIASAQKPDQPLLRQESRLCTGLGYSSRRAIMGSSAAARRAGK